MWSHGIQSLAFGCPAMGSEVLEERDPGVIRKVPRGPESLDSGQTAGSIQKGNRCDWLRALSDRDGARDFVSERFLKKPRCILAERKMRETAAVFPEISISERKSHDSEMKLI